MVELTDLNVLYLLRKGLNKFNLKRIFQITLLLFVILYFLSHSFEALISATQQKELCPPNGKDCLYLKWYARGLNYEEHFLTYKKNRKHPNKGNDHYFQSSGQRFYHFDGTQLFIYCGSLPKNHKLRISKQIDVKYIELNNTEFMKYRELYLQGDLNIFPD